MDKRINSSAERLALLFSDGSDIPTRFRSKKEEKGKINLNSMIEYRFKENTNSWKTFIEIILSKIEEEQAWRFISLNPKIEKGIESVTNCQDFLDFTDFAIMRRDVENCGDNRNNYTTFFMW